MAENFVKIKDSEIKEALKDGDILAFFDLFVSHYADVFKDGYTAEAMAKLNASQHTIWAYTEWLWRLLFQESCGKDAEDIRSCQDIQTSL